MKKKHVSEIIIDVIIVLIIISLYIFSGIYLYNNFKERKRKEISKNIIKQVENEIKENVKKDDSDNIKQEVKVKYNNFNYTVLGRVIIKKINFDQPILKENTKKAYDTAIVRMNDINLNSYGNLALGGHNFMKGNYFIKINKLVKNDIITIKDLSGNKKNYYVYEYKVTSINDVSYLLQPENKNDKIVTLVTCTKGGQQRYYVKARAK